MIDVDLKRDRVDRSRALQIGEDWIQAVAGLAFDRLEELCHPGVISRLLTPSRCVTLDHSSALKEKVRAWFGECSPVRVEHSRVALVGERVAVFYRLHLQEHRGWFTVEQQAYCTVEDGRIAELQLLCSGFQPAAAAELHLDATAPESALLENDNLLVVRTAGSENGSTCTLLTPAIKARLREMPSGQVLEVRVDDASARGDIEAWCRLSGNPLLQVIETETAELRFFVKKK